jgi:thiamine transport system substrate-binding protein
MLHFKGKAIVITSLSILASAIFLPASQAAGKIVTLVTHDSFVMDKNLIADFDKQSGYDLHLVKAGDAGALTNRLILTKGAPIADAVFGIDNTFAGLAMSNGLIEGKLIPTDFGDVCFNYDKLWFDQHKILAPTTVKQLTSTVYKNLTVVENPNSSSTGLAFLAASVDLFGKSGWVNFWKSLKRNGVKVDSGWDAAYSTDFSGSSGKGKFPIVLSYASSPADEVRANGQSQTASFTDGCFRQTEFVGVLNGTKNPAGAAAIVKYLTGAKFQASFPGAMYMYPQIKGTPIPEQWKKFTQIATRTYGDRLDINANRKSWLAQWTAIFNG